MPITTGQARILHAFVSRPGRILERDQIFSLGRLRDVTNSARAVHTQISRLRRLFRLGAAAAPPIIRVVRSEGYLFETAVQVRRSEIAAEPARAGPFKTPSTFPRKDN